MKHITKLVLTLAFIVTTLTTANAASICGYDIELDQIETPHDRFGKPEKSHRLGEFLVYFMEVHNSERARSIDYLANKSVVCYPKQGKAAAVLLNIHEKPILAILLDL